MENLTVKKTFNNNGHSKAVHLLADRNGKKIVRKEFLSKEVFQREVDALTILQKYNFVPRLIHIDQENKTIYMSYCGKCLNRSKFFDNGEKINKMIKRINSTGLYHNDLKPRNVCSLKGNLYIIDFSLATKDKYWHKKGTSSAYTLNMVKLKKSKKRKTFY
jgi:tRNA A-37 threonylcarbamoyl transferase component Bud32